MKKKVLYKSKPDSKYGDIYFISQPEEWLEKYFSDAPILSFNKKFMFVLGSRSTGKSYNQKERIFSDFIKKGRKSVYLRRSKSEINRMAIENYWCDFLVRNTDINPDDFEFKFDDNGSSCSYKGETFLYFLCLNKSSVYKSIPFQNIWNIVFDEFNISVNRFMNYLEDEVNRMLEIYGTMKRPYFNGKKELIPDTKVIMLGNNMEGSNPYTRYFDLEYGDEPGFYFNEIAIIQVFKNNKSKEVYSNLEKTDYGQYAINNVSFRNNGFLIKEKPVNAKPYINLVIERKYLTVSMAGSEIYISSYYKNNKFNVYRLKDDNIDNSVIHYDALKNTVLFDKIKAYYRYNKVFYENENVLQLFEKFMKIY